MVDGLQLLLKKMEDGESLLLVDCCNEGLRLTCIYVAPPHGVGVVPVEGPHERAGVEHGAPLVRVRHEGLRVLHGAPARSPNNARQIP